MATLRDKVTCRNFINVIIRLPIATFLVHIFSHWLFSTSRAQQLVQIFTTTPSFQFPGRAAKDLATLQKMFRLWPPQLGSGLGEFSLAFTISLILFIRLVDIPVVLQSVFGYQGNSKVLNFLLTPLYTSLIPFTLLLPMMRLAEMHIFVLALNFVHFLVCSYIVYGVWYIFKRERSDVEEKAKVE